MTALFPDVDHLRAARENLVRVERMQWERACRRDLTAWTREALRPMEQAPARHHRLLLDHLARVARGEIRRLMVCMPPGSAKSTYCSKLFPAWFFAQRSNLDIIAASHGSELAEDFSKDTQGYIRQYPEILDYGLATENVKRWRTTNGGFYRAAGVGGSITGRRADGAIIDDPVKGAAEAESTAIREQTWNWYQFELYTRLKPGAWIIVVMTRWNEDDLGGRLIAAAGGGADRWTVLKLPAIAELDDPMGRLPGEALWPEWQDEIALLGGTDVAGEYVAGIRANVGEHVWGALYQQDPKPRGAAFFDLDDLLIDGAEGQPAKMPAAMPTRCSTVYATVDTAIKAGQQHNSTGVVWWSYDELLMSQQVKILDWDLKQIEGADQADWLPSVFARGEELARQCGARRGFAGAMIEDKATGTVLLQQAANLRRAGKYAPAYALDTKLTAMGKEERAIAASPYVHRGDIKFATEAYEKTKVHKGRSANHLIVQVSNFRLGSKETDGLDLLDCFTYGVSVARGSNAGDRRGI